MIYSLERVEIVKTNDLELLLVTDSGEVVEVEFMFTEFETCGKE